MPATKKQAKGLPAFIKQASRVQRMNQQFRTGQAPAAQLAAGKPKAPPSLSAKLPPPSTSGNVFAMGVTKRRSTPKKSSVYSAANAFRIRPIGDINRPVGPCQCATFQSCNCLQKQLPSPSRETSPTEHVVSPKKAPIAPVTPKKPVNPKKPVAVPNGGIRKRCSGILPGRRGAGPKREVRAVAIEQVVSKKKQAPVRRSSSVEARFAAEIEALFTPEDSDDDTAVIPEKSDNGVVKEQRPVPSSPSIDSQSTSQKSDNGAVKEQSPVPSNPSIDSQFPSQKSDNGAAKKQSPVLRSPSIDSLVTFEEIDDIELNPAKSDNGAVNPEESDEGVISIEQSDNGVINPEQNDAEVTGEESDNDTATREKFDVKPKKRSVPSRRDDDAAVAPKKGVAIPKGGIRKRRTTQHRKGTIEIGKYYTLS